MNSFNVKINYRHHFFIFFTNDLMGEGKEGGGSPYNQTPLNYANQDFLFVALIQ